MTNSTINAIDLIQKLPSALDPKATASTKAVIQFNLSVPHYVTIDEGTATVTEGTTGKPTVTLTMKDNDFVALLMGDLNGVTAYMTGRLKAQGDLMLAQRLSGFFPAANLA